MTWLDTERRRQLASLWRICTPGERRAIMRARVEGRRMRERLEAMIDERQRGRIVC